MAFSTVVYESKGLKIIEDEPSEVDEFGEIALLSPSSFVFFTQRTACLGRQKESIDIDKKQQSAYRDVALTSVDTTALDENWQEIQKAQNSVDNSVKKQPVC
jgi:hypothetical protein